MTAFRFKYSVRFRLPGDPEAPAALGEKFLQTLDALSRIGPIFDDWHIIDARGRSWSPLAAARPRMTALVEKNVYRDDWGNRCPDEGYSAAAKTKNSLETRSVSISARAGGKGEGEIWLHAGYFHIAPDPSIVTYPVFKAALLAINTIWPPIWANADAFEGGYTKAPLIPGVPLFPGSVFHMSWISYLSAQRAAGLQLPAEILTERTPDGGLLMIAAEERLDPTNPDHLRRSRILAETMIAHAGEPRAPKSTKKESSR